MSQKRALQRLIETVDLPENVRSELRSLVRRNTQPPVNAQQLEWLLVDNAKIQDAAINTAKIEDLTVTDAKINTLTASKITAGTISGEEIIIATDSGGTAGTIRSDNYTASESGWQIDSDGNAEFNNITARGTIDNTVAKIYDDRIEIWTGVPALEGTIEPDAASGMLIYGDDGGAQGGSVQYANTFVRMQSPNESNFVNVDDTNGTLVEGDFEVTGSKNARITDPDADSTHYVFSAVEADEPGLMVKRWLDVEINGEKQIPFPEHFARIGKNPAVRIDAAGPPDENTPHFPYGWANWDPANPYLELRAPKGRYHIRLEFARADAAVEGWQHVRHEDE